LSQKIVLIDLDVGKRWIGPWVGKEYRPLLIRTREGHWYCGRDTLDGYETPPGCPFGVRWLQLSLKEALFWCSQQGTTPPAELIEEYESSKSRVNASQTVPIVNEPEASSDLGSEHQPPSGAAIATSPPDATTKVSTAEVTISKPKRLKGGDASAMIVAALDYLANKGEWNASEKQIYKLAGVSRSTYYNVKRRDVEVQNVFEKYHSRRLGRGPVHYKDV
jgi:hypothetical protein